MCSPFLGERIPNRIADLHYLGFNVLIREDAKGFKLFTDDNAKTALSPPLFFNLEWRLDQSLNPGHLATCWLNLESIL